MTDKQFNAWASRHCFVFAFSLESNAQTFAEWYEVFKRSGYTAKELNEATDRLSRREQPLQWLRDHLAHIHGLVRQIRHESRRDAADKMDRFRAAHGCNLSEAEIEAGRKLLHEHFARIGYKPKCKQAV